MPSLRSRWESDVPDLVLREDSSVDEQWTQAKSGGNEPLSYSHGPGLGDRGWGWGASSEAVVSTQTEEGQAPRTCPEKEQSFRQERRPRGGREAAPCPACTATWGADTTLPTL